MKLVYPLYVLKQSSWKSLLSIVPQDVQFYIHSYHHSRKIRPQTTNASLSFSKSSIKNINHSAYEIGIQHILSPIQKLAFDSLLEFQ